MNSPWAFRARLAADTLAAGGIVAHPTEAVWGLACRPDHAAAVQRLLALKQRDPGKGLILVAERIDRFAALLSALPESAYRDIVHSWPGPVTWVVPDEAGLIPAWVRGRHHSVALRVTDHALTAELCRQANSPLVSTSANPAGQRPAKTALEARRYFGDAVDYYLHGDTGRRAQPTTIRDALTGAVLRPG